MQSSMRFPTFTELLLGALVTSTLVVSALVLT
jgi:hypothetical protein